MTNLDFRDYDPRHDLPATKGCTGMTEAEARVCGAAANRIVNLRGLELSNEGNGSLTVNTKSGAVSLALTQEDIAAFLALAIDRESALLTGFNIVLDQTPA